MKVLFETQEFDVEHEGGVGGDDPGVALLPVSEVRGARQLGALAHRHLSNTLVPASDDLSLADAELERLAAVTGGVKLLPVGQGTGVVNHHGLA